MLIDTLLFQKINGLAGKKPVLDELAVFFASYLAYPLTILELIILWQNKTNSRFVYQTIGAAILARLIIAEVLHCFFPRQRPCAEGRAKSLINCPESKSFPSGHATFYFSVAVSIFLFNQPIGLLLLAATILIAFFRIFVGVHWPSDILAGAVIGISSNWIIFLLSKTFF